MQVRHLVLTVFVMMIWGVNFSAIKTGVSQFDPFLIAAARFFFATFPAILFIKKPSVPVRYFIAYGLVFGTGVWGMASCAITFGLSSGMAAMLLQMNVLTSIIVGVLIYKEVLTVRMIVGVAIALLGLLLSVMYTNGNVTLLGVIFITVSAISWPIAGVIVRKSKTQTPFAFNVWGMLFAPAPLIVFSLSQNGFSGFISTLHAWNEAAWISVLFQAYPTTLFGYWVWSKMLLVYPMSRLAPLTLLTVVFALISGFIFFGETLATYQWVSCSLFLTGIVLVLSPKDHRFGHLCRRIWARCYLAIHPAIK